MASTNKTTNILLSQFLGTDHFSFLTDYNGDMLKIDTFCGNLKALIDGASSKVEGNTESIQNIQSDIQSIQSVQERQNKNITDNTADITQLKKDDAENKANIAKNTEDIKTLQESKGIILDIEVTRESHEGMQNFEPRIKFNTQTNEFYVVGSKSYVSTSVLNGLRYYGKLNASNLPQKVKTAITRGSITSIIGAVKYYFDQTINGTLYSVPITLPLFAEIASEDGTINDVSFSVYPKANLPNADGDVINNPSYYASGVMSLADKVV